MQHHGRRVGTGRKRGDDLATTGDVDPQTFLDHRPLHRGARERLGGEDNLRVGPARGEPRPVLARPLSYRLLGHHKYRCAELAGDLVQPAAADYERAVVVDPSAGREEADELVDGRHWSASSFAAALGTTTTGTGE